jgi:hypothetical protein
VAKKTLKERFDVKVKVNGESGCWTWVGSHDGANYGRISLNGKPAQASRVAYTLYRGPIPEGQVLDHHLYPEGGCVGPTCVNPSHLIPTTRSENSSGNAWKRKTHCPQGHPYSVENTRIEKTAKGTLARRCKTCSSKYIRQWQLRHPERVKGYKAKCRLRTKVGKQVRSVPARNTKAA